MAWQKTSIELAKKALQSDPAKKAGKKGAERAAVAVGGALGAVGISAAKRRSARRKSVKTAIKLAQQVGGQYSVDTIVDGEERCVVWKDGKPSCLFPRLNGEPNAEGLAKRTELQNLPPALLREPPPIKT